MISKRMKEIGVSPTLALAAKAQQLKREGEDVISLAIGEPDWETISSAKNKALWAINNNNKTTYTPAKGILELRQAISKDFERYYGQFYDANKEICVSSGAKISLFAVMQCLLDKEDEIIMPAPMWLSYMAMAGLADGQVKTVTQKDGKISPKNLEALITDKTKMILINSPNNPSGVVYTVEEFEALGRVLEKYPRVIIMSDEIYNKLYFKEDNNVAPSFVASCPNLRDRVVTVNGASKSFAMTGWRVGWTLGPENIISKVTAYLSQSTGCPCQVSQWAAVGALEDGASEVESIRVMLKKRISNVCKKLTELGFDYIKPEGAFYVCLNLEDKLGKYENDIDFCDALLEDKKVVTVPGTYFGMENSVRLSLATSEDLIYEALNRVKDFINENK